MIKFVCKLHGYIVYFYYSFSSDEWQTCHLSWSHLVIWPTKLVKRLSMTKLSDQVRLVLRTEVTNCDQVQLTFCCRLQWLRFCYTANNCWLNLCATASSTCLISYYYYCSSPVSLIVWYGPWTRMSGVFWMKSVTHGTHTELTQIMCVQCVSNLF